MSTYLLKRLCLRRYQLVQPHEPHFVKLPDEVDQNFLIDLCNKIADGIDAAKEDKSFLQSYLTGAAGASEKWYSLLGDYTPLGYVYDAQGAIGQFAGDVAGKLIGRDDLNLGDKASTILDPRKASAAVNKGVNWIFDELPNYIRTTIIPQIPSAVAMYSRFMKYVIAFFGLLEDFMTGNLEKAVDATPDNVVQFPQVVDTDLVDVQAMVAEMRARRYLLEDVLSDEDLESEIQADDEELKKEYSGAGAVAGYTGPLAGSKKSLDRQRKLMQKLYNL